MPFRKLTPFFLLILPLTFALSASSDLKDEEATNKTATMTCDQFIEETTSGMEQHLVTQVRDNEALKEISPTFFPELISIYNIVTANIMGELSHEQRVSIINSLPGLAVESCYLVAARALLFARIDTSFAFPNSDDSRLIEVLGKALSIKTHAVSLPQSTKDIIATKFAADYAPYANVQSTQAYLGALLVQWQTNRPETANEMFKQAFGYWRELTFQGAKLDPRDVVFYLIFGEGITQHQPYLGSSFGIARMHDYPDFFSLNDYVSNYEKLEQDAFKAKESYMSWFLNSLGQALGLY